jgi:hypothetical protein
MSYNSKIGKEGPRITTKNLFVKNIGNKEVEQFRAHCEIGMQGRKGGSGTGQEI